VEGNRAPGLGEKTVLVLRDKALGRGEGELKQARGERVALLGEKGESKEPGGSRRKRELKPILAEKKKLPKKVFDP